MTDRLHSQASCVFRTGFIHTIVTANALLLYFQLSRLFADFAGLTGLWLGFSVFTFLEIVELGLDFIILCVYRLIKAPYWANSSGCNKESRLAINKGGMWV